jgi:hypothetical protein
MDPQEFISNVGRLPSQMAFLKEPLSLVKKSRIPVGSYLIFSPQGG